MSGQNPSPPEAGVTNGLETPVPGAHLPSESPENDSNSLAGLDNSSRGEGSTTLAIGDRLADRYEIVRFIGHGGMGEVYEAKDSLLTEHVALKVVSDRIAHEERIRQRFKREIQLARKVTHPNVCRIYDVGVWRHSDSAQSVPGQELFFLTMELLEGETVAQRLRRVGRLSTVEAQPIIEQVAAGLAASHKAGVIHRDLKLSNILLVSNNNSLRTVITDFGLARSRTETRDSGASISLANEVVGTPEYIAPEQLQGKEASPATDIYALGVVIYAMVTGRLPFSAGDRLATAMQRLYVTPPPPRQYVAGLPPNWNNAILRCLAIDPNARFSNASDVINALESRRTLPMRWVYVAAVLICLLGFGLLSLMPAPQRWIHNAFAAYSLPPRKQVVILPFVATDGNADSSAFARGLAETLTTRLTRITSDQQLQVLPATELRGRQIDTAQQAHREFGVNLGIEGSIERYGSRRRITYYLVNATNSRVLYSETITSDVEDPFGLEDQIASSVEHALRIVTQGSEQHRHDDRRPEPEAYDFYLQGRGYLDQLVTPQHLDDAITVFSKALSIDATYAPAYAGLGEAYWARYQDTHEINWVELAKENCKKAVQTNGSESSGHICLGTVYEGSGQYSEAAREFGRAVTLQPTDDEATRGLATALSEMGESSRAEDVYKNAIRLRPGYWRGYSMLGVFYYVHGNYDKAQEMFRQVIALSPDNYDGYSDLGAISLIKGEYQDALSLFKNALQISSVPNAYSNIGTTYFYLHKFTEARHAFEQAAAVDSHDYVLWGNLAESEIHIKALEPTAATHYEKAVELGLQQLRVNPKAASLLSNLALYFAMLGKRETAELYLDRVLALTKNDPATDIRVAAVYNVLKQHDLAFQWIARATRDGWPATLIRDSPSFEDLRAYPQFRSALGVK